VEERSLSAHGVVGQRPESICGGGIRGRPLVRKPRRAALHLEETQRSKGEIMRSQALPTRTVVGSGTIWRMVAAVERRVARMTSRRRRGDVLQREEVTKPLTAGISRGLTLFVDNPGTAARRQKRL
jgi:hypothetical protein